MPISTDNTTVAGGGSSSTVPLNDIGIPLNAIIYEIGCSAVPTAGTLNAVQIDIAGVVKDIIPLYWGGSGNIHHTIILKIVNDTGTLRYINNSAIGNNALMGFWCYWELDETNQQSAEKIIDVKLPGGIIASKR